MKYSENIYWAIPEIFLVTAIVALLAYGVVYSKLEGKYSQQRKITWLSILTLAFTSILVLDQIQLFLHLTENSVNALADSICASKTLATRPSGIYIAGVFGVDILTLVTKFIILISAAIILILSLDFYASHRLAIYEYTLLILLSVLGMLILVSARDLISLYLGIELVSLSLYVLAGIERKRQYSTEAALKYFLLGALSSGLLLMGSTLIYTFSGETTFSGLSSFLWYSHDDLGLKAGAVLMVVAMLFKLAAAPFHMWAPDVYEGSPTIVTAFFAIVPKIAVLTALITLLFGPLLGLWNEGLQSIILVSACASLIVGALGGLNQTKLKRLLAYSAIGHMGFILLALGTSTLWSIQAVYVYIIYYIIMSIAGWTMALSIFKGSLNYIAQLSGLSRTQPVLAATLALTLFSMAGIPPLAGFFSKYLVLLGAIDNQLYLVSIIAVLASVVSAFYYLRIIKWMYFKDTTDYHYKDLVDVSITKIEVDLPRSLILGVSMWFILTLLIYPNPLLNFIFDIVSGFVL